jgi:hypothetical protein
MKIVPPSVNERFLDSEKKERKGFSINDEEETIFN